jgi:threonine/homoserine/homoserine lactone efflux protein
MHIYLVTTLNPKGVIFFVAFLPQFLDLGRPIVFQMVIFEITFLFLATLNAAVYGLLAAMARRTMRKPRTQCLVNRVGGSLMIGAGVLAVSWNKGAAAYPG